MTLWKAILVLFVVSDAAPPSMLLGKSRSVFRTEQDCRDFLTSKRDEIKGNVELLSADGEARFQVVWHRASCVKHGSGQPT